MQIYNLPVKNYKNVYVKEELNANTFKFHQTKI